MKSLLSILGIVGLLLLLAGCGAGKPEVTKSEQASYEKPDKTIPDALKGGGPPGGAPPGGPPPGQAPGSQ